jgi:ribosomal protein S17E
MKKIALGLIYFVLLFNQSLIFNMEKKEQAFNNLFDNHKKTTDDYAKNAGKTLRESLATGYTQKKALEKRQNNNDDQESCKCTIF